jgi:hypothetical protein
MQNKKRKKKGKLIWELGKPMGIIFLVGSLGLHAWDEAQIGLPQKHVHIEYNVESAQEMITTTLATSAGTTTSILTTAGMTTVTYLKF